MIPTCHLSLDDLFAQNPTAFHAITTSDGAASRWTGPLWSTRRGFVLVHAELPVPGLYRCTQLNGEGSPACPQSELFFSFDVDSVRSRVAKVCAASMLPHSGSSGGVWDVYGSEDKGFVVRTVDPAFRLVFTKIKADLFADDTGDVQLQLGPDPTPGSFLAELTLYLAKQGRLRPPPRGVWA